MSKIKELTPTAALFYGMIPAGLNNLIYQTETNLLFRLDISGSATYKFVS